MKTPMKHKPQAHDERAHEAPAQETIAHPQAHDVHAHEVLEVLDHKSKYARLSIFIRMLMTGKTHDVQAQEVQAYEVHVREIQVRQQVHMRVHEVLAHKV